LTDANQDYNGIETMSDASTMTPLDSRRSPVAEKGSPMRHPAISLLACAALAACSSAPPPTTIGAIEIIAEAGANAGSATDLDLVFVYDVAIAAMLPRTGPDWFLKKDAFLTGLATGIEAVNVQLPQGQRLRLEPSARQRKAIAVYSYANYGPATGQPMGNLTLYKNITIRLLPDRIVYAGN
jgi:type VI secretion system protein